MARRIFGSALSAKTVHLLHSGCDDLRSGSDDAEYTNEQRDPLRLEIIDALRGLAALSVAWFHFTNGGGLHLPRESWLRVSGSFGWLGVEVFFVISGFVIPYSLSRGGYRFRKDFGTFLLKRIIRLDPPYLIAIGLTIALWYASALTPGFAGEWPRISAPQLLSHLGYLNAFVGYPWLSPVFWTLAIEFQYYILVAIAFPMFASRSKLVRLLALFLLMASAATAVDRRELVFHYGGLFALGIVTFQKHMGLWSFRSYLVLLAAASALTASTLGPLIAAVGTGTAVSVGFAKVARCRPLALLGAVTYSLYLLHVPIGGRVVNFGARFAQARPAQLSVVLAALASSLLAAYVMFRLVERPAQRWSSSFKYRRSAIASSLKATVCRAGDGAGGSDALEGCAPISHLGPAQLRAGAE